MWNEEPTFMDIDDELVVHQISLQLSALRRDKLSPAVSLGAAEHHERAEQAGLPVGTRALLVVDTNFLISHLGFLNTLVSVHAKSHGVVLIIPWIVIQELDGLKNARDTRPANGSSHSQPLGALARNATNFIHACLERKDPTLRGQRIQECLHPDAETNDDRILDCCLYLQSTTPLPVTLLSNDTNLCVKAMIHDVQAISAKNRGEMPDFLIKILNARPTHMNGNNGDVDGLLQPSHISVDSYIEPTSLDDEMMLDDDYTSDSRRSTYQMLADGPDELSHPNDLSSLTATIVAYLSAHLPQAMLYCYSKSLGSQDAINYILGPDHQYPWRTLSEMIGLIFNHWFSVFESTAGLPKHAKHRLSEAEIFIRDWERKSQVGLVKVYRVDVGRFLDGVEILMQIIGVIEEPAGRKKGRELLSGWREVWEKLPT